MNMWAQRRPVEPNRSPGSSFSQEHGCICPSQENNAGQTAPFPPDGWWISTECLTHRAVLVLGKISEP